MKEKGLSGQQLEDKLQLEYEMGQTVVYEELASEFAKRSGDAFATRRDDTAKIYRGLEDEFNERGKKLRTAYSLRLTEYEKKYQKE